MAVAVFLSYGVSASLVNVNLVNIVVSLLRFVKHKNGSAIFQDEF